MENSELPDIERERLERIERNRQAMRALGVLDAAERVASTLQGEQAAAAAAAAQAIAKHCPSPGAPARRSRRPASRLASKKLAEAAVSEESAAEEASQEHPQQNSDSSANSDSSSGAGTASKKRKAATPLPPCKHRHTTDKQRQAEEEQEYMPSGSDIPSGSDTDNEADDAASEGFDTERNAEQQEQRQQHKKQVQKRKHSASTQLRAHSPTAATCEAAAAVAGYGAGDAAKPPWATDALMQLGTDDWELQLALQMSMQGNGAAQVAATTAGASNVEPYTAVLVSDVDAPGAPAAATEHQAAAGDVAKQEKPLSSHQHCGQRQGKGRKRAGCASREPQERVCTEADGVPSVKPSSSSRSYRKKSTSKAISTGGQVSDGQSLSDADLFDLFAKFEPGNDGAIGKSHLLQQMLKAGMDADGELAERMLQYAKNLAAQQQALAGQSPAVMSGRQLEYEEFLVLGQLMG